MVLRNNGIIDPENIDEYIARGGYQALSRVLRDKSEDIIENVLASGLRGKGGAGFSAGQKWQKALETRADQKYIVCNANESDPDAFMDKSIMEGDPHALLEGMLIAGCAIGSNEGIIYVRAEYSLAVERLQKAVFQAEEYGLLGSNILNSGHNFEIKIQEGPGWFVCGEETALLASIEGKRSMPRPRPPFPATEGLWGKPTVIQNVETFVNIPLIFNGREGMADKEANSISNTKVLCLAGKLCRTGLVEVPMGITLQEIIFDIGGGMDTGKSFKAVQIGGPTGGCLPEDKLDLSYDYESLAQAGMIMGSGVLLVMDEDTCMVNAARRFVSYMRLESCGKCTPCREGIKRMHEILERICGGNGKEGDLELLEELTLAIQDSSLCGLGQTSPNPVLSTLRYFRPEYEEHILSRKCRAKVCRGL